MAARMVSRRCAGRGAVVGVCLGFAAGLAPAYTKPPPRHVVVDVVYADAKGVTNTLPGHLIFESLPVVLGGGRVVLYIKGRPPMPPGRSVDMSQTPHAYALWLIFDQEGHRFPGFCEGHNAYSLGYHRDHIRRITGFDAAKS